MRSVGGLCVLPVLGLAFHQHAMIGESGKWYGNWTERQLPSYLHEGGYVVETTEYLSPAMHLKTGEAHFTLNPLTRMPFPKGDYSVIRADFHVVDGTGNDKIPLSELYNHHWLVGAQDNVDPLFACEHNMFWGAGAEMRNTPTIIPDGYAFKRTNAAGWCGANLHFIRTQDLATKWHGLNDPSQFEDPAGAAAKNCIECGWAPKRATECIEPLDGNFACCFTLSRCPVNNPHDKSHKEYRLKYQVQWTRDLTSMTVVTGTVLDLSGGSIEWNIKPNKKNALEHTWCDNQMCNISRTWTVDKMGDFGTDNLCSGTMIWSYVHQHNGAINGSMFINGKHHCTSEPTIGTDPNNTPGNELGYVTGFSKCVDKDNLGNHVRLNKGDKVTVEALYDVDKTSHRNFPFPGGKHGGIMGLYFLAMDCDDGKWPYQFHCQDNQCVKVRGAKYKTLSDCESSCKKDEIAV